MPVRQPVEPAADLLLHDELDRILTVGQRLQVEAHVEDPGAVSGRRQRHGGRSAEGAQVGRHLRGRAVVRQGADAHGGPQAGAVGAHQGDGQVVAPGRGPHVDGVPEPQHLGALAHVLLDRDQQVVGPEGPGHQVHLEGVGAVAGVDERDAPRTAEGAQVGRHPRLPAVAEPLEAHRGPDPHRAGQGHGGGQVVFPAAAEGAVGDLQDQVGAVVAGDVEAAVVVGDHAHWEAPDGALGRARLEAGHELADAGVAAVGVAEQHRDVVPGMGGLLRPAGVEGDEGRVAVPARELVARVEVDPHGGVVGRHEADRRRVGGHEGAVLGGDRQQLPVLGNPEVVPLAAAVHEGSAHEVVVAHDVDPLGRREAALLVVAVVVRPQLVGHRMQGHADGVAHAGGEDAPPRAVGVELQDLAALGAVRHLLGRVAHDLQAGLLAAQVAARTHGDVELLVDLVEDDRARVVPALPRDVADDDLPFLVDEVAVVVAGPLDAVLVAHVQIALVEGQAVSLDEAPEGDDLLVGDAVAVAVGQGDDLAAAHVAHVEHAAIVEGHQPGLAEQVAGGEDLHREARRQVDGQALGDVAAEPGRDLDLDGLQAEVDRRRQDALGVAARGPVGRPARVVAGVVLGRQGEAGRQGGDGRCRQDPRTHGQVPRQAGCHRE